MVFFFATPFCFFVTSKMVGKNDKNILQGDKRVVKNI